MPIWTALEPYNKPIHGTYSLTLTAHPRRQTTYSSSWTFIQDWHARHETCTFSPYPSACRTTAYSFETQTWERAWGRWKGRRSMDCGKWSHKEKTGRRSARQVWGVFGVGSEEKENKNRWWKTKMKGSWSRWVKNLSKGENKKVSAVRRAGQILVK